jgi:hypothetical protein
MKIADFPVVDAKKKLTITITPQDIAKGDTKDPGACAAAQACMRQANCTKARVHIGRTYLLVDKKWVRYHTPRSLRGEIISFDRGTTFQPGEYTLMPMRPSARTGKAQSRTQNHPKPKVRLKHRTKPHVVHGIRERGANR